MTATMERIRHLPAGTGRSFTVLGDIITFKTEPKDTEGALLMFENTLPPAMGVPPHREQAAEAFYVLDGTLEVEADGEHYRLGPGDYLGLTPGVVHSLRNPGPSATRVLTFVSPGSRHARFFAEVGQPLADGTTAAPPAAGKPDIPRLISVGRECGIEFLPPKGSP